MTAENNQDVTAADFASWQRKVADTLINPKTLLATDYLNHFNEVIMLINMIADIPEMLPDIQNWHYKTYPQHFLESKLDYGPLAAEAFEHAPESYKEPFESVVRQLAQVVRLTVKRIEGLVATGDTEELRRTTSSAVQSMTGMAEIAGAIIAGDTRVAHQDEIDKMLAG